MDAMNGWELANELTERERIADAIVHFQVDGKMFHAVETLWGEERNIVLLREV